MPEDFGREINPRSPEVDRELLYVPMSFAEATSATDPKPKIGTSSLASCAGIGLYDPANKVGGVAHVFFNEKMTHTWTDYMYDSQGRSIPNTGRTHHQVVDNPYWYREFEYLMNELLRKAKDKGGQAYEFHGFNVLQGARTQKQNEQLSEFAQDLVKKLQEKSVIVGNPDWKLWQGFILDTRTGLFTPL